MTSLPKTTSQQQRSRSNSLPGRRSSVSFATPPPASSFDALAPPAYDSELAGHLQRVCTTQIPAVFSALPESIKSVPLVARPLQRLLAGAAAMTVPRALVLVGERGVGKSASGNAMLGVSVLPTAVGGDSVTLWPVRVLPAFSQIAARGTADLDAIEDKDDFVIGLSILSPLELIEATQLAPDLGTIQSALRSNGVEHTLTGAIGVDAAVALLKAMADAATGDGARVSAQAAHKVVAALASLDAVLDEYAGMSADAAARAVAAEEIQTLGVAATVLVGLAPAANASQESREIGAPELSTRRFLPVATVATSGEARNQVTQLMNALASNTATGRLLQLVCGAVDVHCWSALPYDMYLIDMPGWGDMPIGGNSAARRELGRLVCDKRSILVPVSARSFEPVGFMKQMPELMRLIKVARADDPGKLIVAHYFSPAASFDEAVREETALKKKLNVEDVVRYVLSQTNASDAPEPHRFVKVAQQVVQNVMLFPRVLHGAVDDELRAKLLDCIRGRAATHEFEQLHRDMATCNVAITMALKSAVNRKTTHARRSVLFSKPDGSSGTLQLSVFNNIWSDVIERALRVLDESFRSKLMRMRFRLLLLVAEAGQVDAELGDVFDDETDDDDDNDDNDDDNDDSFDVERQLRALGNLRKRLRHIEFGISPIDVFHKLLESVLESLFDLLEHVLPSVFAQKWREMIEKRGKKGAANADADADIGEVADDTCTVLRAEIEQHMHALSDTLRANGTRLLAQVAPDIVAVHRADKRAKLPWQLIYEHVLPGISGRLAPLVVASAGELEKRLRTMLFGEEQLMLTTVEAEQLRSQHKSAVEATGVDELFEKAVADKRVIELAPSIMTAKTRDQPTAIDGAKLLAKVAERGSGSDASALMPGRALVLTLHHTRALPLARDLLPIVESAWVSEGLSADDVADEPAANDHDDDDDDDEGVPLDIDGESDSDADDSDGTPPLRAAKITGMTLRVPLQINAIVDKYVRVLKASRIGGVLQPQSKNEQVQTDASFLMPIVVPVVDAGALPDGVFDGGLEGGVEGDYKAPARLVLLVATKGVAAQLAADESLAKHRDSVMICSLPDGCVLVQPAALELALLVVRDWLTPLVGADVDMLIVPAHTRARRLYRSSAALVRGCPIGIDVALHYLQSVLSAARSECVVQATNAVRAAHDVSRVLARLRSVEVLEALSRFQNGFELSELMRLHAMLRGIGANAAERAVAADVAASFGALPSADRELIERALLAPVDTLLRIWCVRCMPSRIGFVGFAHDELFQLHKQPRNAPSPLLLSMSTLRGRSFLARGAELVPTPYALTKNIKHKPSRLARALDRLRSSFGTEFAVVAVGTWLVTCASPGSNVSDAQPAVEKRLRLALNRTRARTAHQAALGEAGDEDEADNDEDEGGEEEQQEGVHTRAQIRGRTKSRRVSE